MTKSSTKDGTLDGKGSKSGRAKLVVLVGGQVGRRFVLDKSAVVGRATECTVTLDDSEVSREHAEVVAWGDGNRYAVRDLGSTNGTYVNEMPIKERGLEYGDKIRFGSRATVLFTRHDDVEEALLRQQRLELLGQLAAGVVHDLNNMLGAILSTVDYLLDVPSVDHQELDTCLNEIRAAARRSAELTPRLLSFARGSRQGHGQVDMAEICRETMAILRHSVDGQIALEQAIASDLRVIGDPIELHQVLMNLCVNAIHAMPDGGRLTLSAQSLSDEERKKWSLDDDEDYVVVTVADTGMGMSADTIERAFEPYFTTKGADQGTGLGLSSVRELITLHGGEVRVESEPEKGTRFFVILSAASDSPRQAAPTQPPRASMGKTQGRLLLIDDEPAILRGFGRALRHRGFTVDTAQAGAEGVERYRRASTPYDVVLLDLDMPAMSGLETLGLIREGDPSARILIMTGKLDQTANERARSAGAVGVLVKPIAVQVLVERVTAAISGDEPSDCDRTDTHASLPAVEEPK